MTKQISFDPQAVAQLYDDIADVYASYYTDYDAAVRKQGADLAAVIRTHGKADAMRVLDCSCGIGTQAIGLALAGLKPDACDISPKSIAEAKANAAKYATPIDFAVCDMRRLKESPFAQNRYDAVISCGNSLAHLLAQEDIEHVFTAAYDLLESGGVFLAALTDHENKEPRSEQQFYDPHIKRHSDGRKTMNFQVWTWVKPGEIYICDDYTLTDHSAGSDIDAKKVSAPFRIWPRAQLFALGAKAGFTAQNWLTPDMTGHHNPILCLKKQTNRP